MAENGADGVLEWVDSLSGPDLDTVLACVHVSAQGTEAEKRYRLMRYQMRQSGRANISWSSEDVEPARNRTTSTNDLPEAAPCGSGLPGLPRGPRASLSTDTQVTFSGSNAYPVVSSTTACSVTASTVTSWVGFPVRPQMSVFQQSLLRGEGFATGTPTGARSPPPLTEPFSFIASQPSVDSSRAAETLLRPAITAGPAGPTSSLISGPMASASRANGMASAASQQANLPSFPSAPIAWPTSNPAYSLPPLSSLTAGANAPHLNVHAGDIVRKWQLKFGGRRDHSAEEFLLRVEECRRGTRLTELDLLDAMPYMLQGLALQWFRLERPRWKSWLDFVNAFRRRFGGVNFQLRVREEVRRRTQGPEEPISDYLVGLRHIMSYVMPPYSLVEQIDFAYANLHPSYRAKIDRDSISTLEELESKGEQIEASRLLSREYRPPPTPQDSLFPEHAYAGSRGNTRTSLAASMEIDDDMPSLTSAAVASPNSRAKKETNRRSTVAVVPIPSTPAKSKVSQQHNSGSASPPTTEVLAATSGGLTVPPQNNASPSSSSRKFKCYWCEAPDVTTRTCENAACVERRKLKGNERRRRRYGSTSPQSNKDPQ